MKTIVAGANALDRSSGLAPSNGFDRSSGAEPSNGFDRSSGAEPSNGFDRSSGAEPANGFDRPRRPASSKDRIRRRRSRAIISNQRIENYSKSPQRTRTIEHATTVGAPRGIDPASRIEQESAAGPSSRSGQDIFVASYNHLIDRMGTRNSNAPAPTKMI